MVVLTETTSNVHHPSFIHSIDSLIIPLSEAELANLKPDILYYNKMIGMSYEEAKSSFFSEVGR